MKRREMIKGMGALAGVAGAAKLLSACGSSSGSPAKPGTIDTLVYLMMENRSYDHLLGARALVEGKPGDGLTAGMSNPDKQGNLIAPWQMGVPNACVPDPPHSWDASHAQFNGGAMNGFVTQYQQGHPGNIDTMQYIGREDMPVTWALADAYASCDRWFASVMGPTWPNRFYWLSGTSMGNPNNSIPDGGFTAPTIFGRLDDLGIGWKVYYGDVPFAVLMGEIDADIDQNSGTTQEFFADAAAGKLPPVVYLDPPFGNADDHPPHHPILGQQFIASIYNALASSPQWERCLLVITYDEHGGFFDHVPPPMIDDDYTAQGFNQLGIRVPAVVVGPYVKNNYVSSVVRNHASGLRHIETVFGTKPLNARTKASPDLMELIDLDRLAKGAPGEPVAIPTVNVDQWVIDGSCDGSSLRRPDHDILREAHDHPEWTANVDQRHRLLETSNAIAARARAGITRPTLADMNRYAR